MRIINTTDIAKGTGVKVIGIGEYRILPGESAEIPDEIAYIRNGGKLVVAPSIAALARTNQIRFEEIDKATPTAAHVDIQSHEGNFSNNGGTDENSNEEKEPDAAAEQELTDEEKKAIAAKKRAEARAAKKVAEEVSKSASTGKAK